MNDPVQHVVAQWRRERPDLDATPILVVGRIARVDAKLDAALRPPFAEAGLGSGDFDVLAALRRSGEPFTMRPADLSRALLVTTGAVTKRLDRLERQGHVDRSTPVDEDGRGKLARLTPSGRRLVDDLIAVHLANERRLLGALTRAEQRTLADLLRRLDASLPD